VVGCGVLVGVVGDMYFEKRGRGGWIARGEEVALSEGGFGYLGIYHGIGLSLSLSLSLPAC